MDRFKLGSPDDDDEEETIVADYRRYTCAADLYADDSVRIRNLLAMLDKAEEKYSALFQRTQTTELN